MAAGNFFIFKTEWPQVVRWFVELSGPTGPVADGTDRLVSTSLIDHPFSQTLDSRHHGKHTIHWNIFTIC